MRPVHPVGELAQETGGRHGAPAGTADVGHVGEITLELLGVLIAYVAYQARSKNLIPVRDPRLARSLAFENM